MINQKQQSNNYFVPLMHYSKIQINFDKRCREMDFATFLVGDWTTANKFCKNVSLLSIWWPMCICLSLLLLLFSFPALRWLSTEVRCGHMLYFLSLGTFSLTLGIIALSLRNLWAILRLIIFLLIKYSFLKLLLTINKYGYSLVVFLLFNLH